MAIDVNDPLAENLNDIQDVDKIMPGFLKVNIHHLEVTHEKQFTFKIEVFNQLKLES